MGAGGWELYIAYCLLKLNGYCRLPSALLCLAMGPGHDVHLLEEIVVEEAAGDGGVLVLAPRRVDMLQLVHQAIANDSHTQSISLDKYLTRNTLFIK